MGAELWTMLITIQELLAEIEYRGLSYRLFSIQVNASGDVQNYHNKKRMYFLKIHIRRAIPDQHQSENKNC